jgi:hypothetical protein
MKAADVQSYLDRDWDRARASKDRYWAERKRTLTPEEALRIADGLRLQVRSLRPDWPDAEQRAADIATHVRVSKLLRRVPATRD